MSFCADRIFTIYVRYPQNHKEAAQTQKEWFLLMQGNNRPLQSPDTLIMRFSAPLQTRYDNQTGGII